MSNYTKTVDFAAKDALSPGDPNKIVKGAEIDTEFDNIETAVNSKANANNSTLTGTTSIQTLSINGTPVTATPEELNILDGVTATTDELNYTDGVTSNIQTQLDGKATTAQGDLADSAMQPGDNISDLTNDAGYITSYTETDTLDDVADRGATTDQSITVGGLHVDSTGAIELPTGTDAQRPSPAAGMLRYNTDSGSFEGYTNAWGAIGGGGLTLPEFTADGAITIGRCVALNPDGTVSQVSGSSVSTGFGTATAVTNSDGRAVAMAYDPVVDVIYVADESNRLRAYRYNAGSKSFTLLGTELNAINTRANGQAAFGIEKSNDRFGFYTCVYYEITDDDIAARHFRWDDVAGSFVMGSTNGLDSTTSNDDSTKQCPVIYGGLSADPHDVLIYVTNDSGNELDVAGLEILNSSGSSVSVASGSFTITTVGEGVAKDFAYNPDEDVFALLWYDLGDDSFKITSFTVQGSTGDLTQGSTATVYLDTSENQEAQATLEYDPVNKVFVALWIDANDIDGCVIQCSGTTLTPQTVVTGLFSLDPSNFIKMFYRPDLEGFLVFTDDGSNDIEVRSLTATTTTISAGSVSVSFNTGVTLFYRGDAVYIPDSDSYVIGFSHFNTIDYLVGYNYDLGSSTNAQEYIGIAQATVADTETVSVATFSQLDSNQSGLIPGKTYYIDENNGTLRGDNRGFGIAGVALTGTTLLVGEQIN